MRILIIDDDHNKIDQIKGFVAELHPRATIVERLSYQSGLREIIANPQDVIILDMTMPTFDITETEEGGIVRIFGGREVLRQMRRRRMVTPVIIVTQFDAFGEGEGRKSLVQIKNELAIEYPEVFRGAVYYNTAFTEWKEQLRRLLDHAVRRL